MIPVPMKDNIKSNESGAFILTKCVVKSLQQHIITTKCNGYFRDRQRVKDWMNVKGCGCYGMSTSSTSLAIEQVIKVRDDTQKVLKMSGFSSLKFNKVFMTGGIPFFCKVAVFQMTTTFYDIIECMEKCLNYINENGGFTVFGWYKRGEINDATMVEAAASDPSGDVRNKANVEKVASGDISYHFVHIRPTNPDFF